MASDDEPAPFGPPEPSARDRHLFGPGPKRILSLDGGGVRGIISLAFLERMEDLLARRRHRSVRLHEHFDLVGGASTGAIIGSGLALGLSASQVRAFYETLAPQVFKRSFWRVKGLQAKFDASSLQAALDARLGDRRLDSEDLRTGFCLVMKRMDTASPWIVSNNPCSRFWNGAEGSDHGGTRAFELTRLIRASAAAPHYFDPELIAVDGDGTEGLFIDGGVSPFNNPALYLFLLATLPQHGLDWPVGPERLTIVSVGTGLFRNRMTGRDNRRLSAIGLAFRALFGLVMDTQFLTVGLMQALGETPTPWTINAEVGAMSGLPLPGGPLFRHVRYDVRLEADWLRSELDLAVSPAELRRLRIMDDPRIIPLAYRIGNLAAERQVRLEHFI
ncbi:patatin-like phospholipase family protein [Antarcticirhabdus aurantiaca]|uniref:Patatin-like phospholipase family protein n=1 Tax=Antarcticirhabdus aurantiaca TaxID=2606717 RepID=A0ACD4NHY3_9HYPH|nr:patatin-like phospholipase family protein [Antarcticirhabdus aurantiaca]WAJ26399.1 patatin-like phospholipase family protein [Jeongeuplla avenae]